MATAIRDGITTAYTYNEANQPVGESHAGGALAGLSIARTYDSSLRLATLDALGPGGSIQLVGYTYDSAGRLDQVRNTNSINHTARYTYEPNSRLIRSVAFTNNASGKGMLTTRRWDRLNRLGTIHSQAHLSATSPGLGLGHTYTYNAANQRTRADLADGSYWVYEYDKLGQVISGRRYWADGTLMAGQDFTYQFDDIGNRDTTGGRASAVSDYNANQLNQYETRTVPSKLDILGVANPTQPVEVWKDSDSPSTASRSGEYFHHALTVAYSSYPEVRAKSLFVPNQQASAGRSFVPPAIEDFDHDLDGNLIKDGRWTAYVWDGENRLIEMKRDTETPTEARQRLTFEYDHLGRRVRKRFFTPSGTNWAEQRETIYLYDGWNLVAELDGNNANATLRTYVWGTDLSGSRSGAGGVGGLLWVNNSQTTGGLPTGIQFVAYDGNGNVSGLTSATDGSNTARYEYGPFGESLRTTGPLAAANPIRWSTKVTDDETGLVYYGYRYYNSSTGRWLSRDQLEDAELLEEGPHLYAFVGNDAENWVDVDGGNRLKRFIDLARRLWPKKPLNPPKPSTPKPPQKPPGKPDPEKPPGKPDPEKPPGKPPGGRDPSKPDSKRACTLIRAWKPGAIFNNLCKACWRCDYQCTGSSIVGGGAPGIVRYQIGGCVKITGFAPGWMNPEHCEAAVNAGKKDNPFEGLYEGDLDP